MMRALYSSVAGLRTHQTKMDVIGNNIANVNTVGFKSFRATFATMGYQNTSFASGPNAATGKGGVNAKQIGMGSTFASTAVDIETGGANESTGKAFDLKLSDTNSTSFFIVNTGTENLFTRAGAFTVDGAGYLCMESTGYRVMGWQTDANGNIVKDTVTPLRIMSPQSQTSQPEYTTQAKCSGILDDNNANANSDKGYIMTLNFYDNLGYAYNARFSAQKTGEPKDGQYTINLVDILDSNGKSIISGTDVKLGDLFGTGSVAQGSNVDVTDSYTLASGMSNALKRLAMPTDAATLTYKFPSEFVNERLKTDLPEGLTIQYTARNTNNPDTTANPGDTTVTIWNSSGMDVTSTYTNMFPNLITAAVPGNTDQTNPTPAGNTIANTVTVNSMIAEWDDRNLLGTTQQTTTDQAGNTTTTTVRVLSSSQLEQLAGAFNLNIDTSARVVVTAGAADQQGNPTYTLTALNQGDQVADGVVTALNGAGQRDYTLWDYINQSYVTTATAEEINNADIFTTDLPVDLEFRYNVGDGSFTIVTPSTDGFTMQFSTADGALTYIGQDGSLTQTLRMSMFQTEDNPFSDIQIDFSTLQNLANGKTNTAAIAPGGLTLEGEGKMVGTMTGLQVDNAGKVFASYSNGNSELLGQIAVARFANAAGLESIGDNCYRTTMNSGQFDGIGVEMDSDGSSIDSGTLEMSNVDLATEFTTMITTQRGYQANSRVISTSDSILEELVNLKR